MDSRRSSLTVGELLCAAVVPLVMLVEALVSIVAGCFERRQVCSHSARLAGESIFSVIEVEAFYELFKKLSSSIVDDGLIHKEELQLAPYKTPSGENHFLDRVFDLFDENKNGVIEFEEFIHALNIFHPYANVEEKIDSAFRLYDLRKTVYIEREEVKQMIVAIMKESDLEMIFLKLSLNIHLQMLILIWTGKSVSLNGKNW